MKLTYLSIVLMIVVIIAAPRALAQNVCLSVNGIQSFDLLDDPDNVIIDLNIGAGNSLRGGAWDVNISTVGESWLSEAAVLISNSLGSADPNAIPVAPGSAVNAPGNLPFSSNGIILLSDLGFPDVTVRTDGILRLQFFEFFDDNPNAVDAFWSDLSEADAAVCPGLHLQCANQAACDNAVLGEDAPPPDPDPPPEPEFAINFGLIGSWFNPATSGQGFLLDVIIDRDPPELVLYQFAYALQPGGPERQRWHIAQGAFEPGSDTAVLDVFLVTGGVYNQDDPVDLEVIGFMELKFKNCNEATLTFDIDFEGDPEQNISGVIPIQRLSPDVLCGVLIQ